MLERKVGEEAFKKLLERIVTTACQAGSKGEIPLRQIEARSSPQSARLSIPIAVQILRAAPHLPIDQAIREISWK